MKNCPRCGIKLDNCIFYNTEVDYCPQCLGIFFEKDELLQAKDTKDQELSWLDIDLWKDETKFRISYGIRLCPNCRLPLYEVYYGDSKIIVDVCNLCYGIWLDRGEFKKIIEYLKDKADWKILNEYTKTLLEQLWEVFSGFIGPKSFRDELLDFFILLKLLNYKFNIQRSKIAKMISNLPR